MPNVALRFQLTDGSIDPSIVRSFRVSFLFERIDRLHDTAEEGGRKKGKLLLGLQGVRSTISAGNCAQEQMRMKHETETGTK